jgi:hypothetical protein
LDTRPFPPGNLKGQAKNLEEDDQKEQDARFKQKLNQVKKRLKALEESSDEEAEDEENIEQEAIEIKSMEKRLEKLSKKRPPQKRKYAAEEVKVGSMCIAFAMKRTRLCKVLMIHNLHIGLPRTPYGSPLDVTLGRLGFSRLATMVSMWVSILFRPLLFFQTSGPGSMVSNPPPGCVS